MSDKNKPSPNTPPVNKKNPVEKLKTPLTTSSNPKKKKKFSTIGTQTDEDDATKSHQLEVTKLNERILELTKQRDAVIEEIIKLKNNMSEMRSAPPLVKDSPIIEPRQVTLLADSHGRHISSELSKLLRYCSVSGMVKPGATVSQVTNDMEECISRHEEGACFVIMAGTNDALSFWNISDTLEYYKSVISSLQSQQNLQHRFFFCNVPRMYSVPKNSRAAQNGRRINKVIKEAIQGLSNVFLVDLHTLSDRRIFTRHGLHFSRAGKARVAGLIAREIRRSAAPRQDVPRPSDQAADEGSASVVSSEVNVQGGSEVVWGSEVAGGMKILILK